MKRFIAAVALALGVGGCVPGYDNNDLQLITAFTAKETCSCLFVMGMSEEYCKAWTKESPAVASWTADPAGKTVEASALYLWGARARYLGTEFGCTLDP